MARMAAHHTETNQPVQNHRRITASLCRWHGREGCRSSRHSLPPRRRSRTLAERTPFTLRRKSCQERKSAAYCESCVSFAQTQVFSQHVVNRVLLGDPPLERHPHGKRSAGGDRSTLARRPAAVRRPCSRWSATNSSTSSARFIAWLPAQSLESHSSSTWGS